MKFSEMPYKRPDTEALKQRWTALTKRLEHAATYEEARAAFLEQQALSRSAETQATLASVRHSIDTRDAFTTARRGFGTPLRRSWSSTSRRGRRPCWPPRSARISPRNTAS